jgi:hypothetical protein
VLVEPGLMAEATGSSGGLTARQTRHAAVARLAPSLEDHIWLFGVIIVLHNPSPLCSAQRHSSRQLRVPVFNPLTYQTYQQRGDDWDHGLGCCSIPCAFTFLLELNFNY